MSASGFQSALAYLLAHEGGYSNHPSDPGGPTNFGITIGDYRKYVKPDATAADVKAMTVAQARTIYRARYWDAQRCDELPAGVDYAVFDYGVNSGIGRSGKVLRRVLALPATTSKVSDEVVDAARRADATALVAAICDERLRFLKSLKTWPVFGKGWGRRVAEVKAVSLTMAAQAPPKPPPLPSQISDEQPAARGLFHALISILASLFRRNWTCRTRSQPGSGTRPRYSGRACRRRRTCADGRAIAAAGPGGGAGDPVGAATEIPAVLCHRHRADHRTGAPPHPGPELMLTTILGWLGNLLGGPFAKAAVDAYRARLTAENTSEKIAADLTARALDVDARERDLAAKLVLAEQGRWYTALPRPLFAGAFIIYVWKVVVWDKVLGLGTTDALAAMWRNGR